MPTYSIAQLPPPSTWQEFEIICRDLWEKIWNDTNTKRNGRQGQAQHGVDVYGRPNRGKQWAGIQCKGKDNYANKILTEEELEKEVEKAESFEPTLSEFIVTTTGPKDQKVETLARKITEKHLESNSFSVDVWGWEDIVNKLAEFPELLEKHYPQFIIKSDPKEILAPEYQAVLDDSRDLTKKYMPKEALNILKKLKHRSWENAKPILKYRILTCMGLAKLKMGKSKDAGKLLIKALKYNLDDEKAIYYCAVGHLVLDQLDDAYKLGEKLIKIDKTNDDGYFIVIQAAPATETFDNVLSRIPEINQNSSKVAHSLSHLAARKNDLKNAEKWLKIAIENDEENSPYVKRDLGEILFTIVRRDDKVYTGQISDSQRNKLKDALKYFNEAWRTIVHTETREYNVDWVISLSAIKELLGDLEGSIGDMQAALEIEPENIMIKENIAILIYKNPNKNNQEAINILNEIPDEDKTPQASMLLAELLKNENNYNDSERILKTLLKNDLSEEQLERVRKLLLDVYIKFKRIEEAKRVCKSLCKSDPKNISNIVYKARISKLYDVDNAITLLEKAKTYITDSTPLQHLLLLADEFYYLGMHKEAITIYEKSVDINLNTNLTHRLIDSYYKLGEIGIALKICKKLRENYKKPLEYVSELEISIYNEIDDLEATKNLIKDYLKIFPNNLEMEINQAFIDLRSNNLEDVDSFLNSPLDLEKMTLRHFIGIVKLYNIRDFNEQKWLGLLYEMRRKYFNEYLAHAEYIQNFLSRERKIEISPLLVDLGTAVCIENHGKEEWFILEEKNDIDIKLGEINPKHPLFDQLKDKKVDDEIIINEHSLSPQKGKIIAIKNKYVHALHESMNLINYSPKDFGMSLFSLNGDKEKMFDPYFDVLKEKHKTDNQIETIFMENWIPVGTFSEMGHSNVLDTWLYLANNFNIVLRCYTNSPEENSSIWLLKDNNRLIIDLVSLFTIHETNTKENIIKTFGKLGIAQSSMDVLNQVLYETSLYRGREYINTAWIDGRPTYQKVTAEDTEKRIEYIEKLIKWTNSNCEILPCNAALEMNKNKRLKYSKALGKSFMDTILIASEKGNLLYSDDAPLRRIAYTEFHINGIWTQATLMECLERNNLEKSVYDEAIVKLICFNYQHLFLNEDIILKSAELSEWLPLYPFSRVIGKIFINKPSAVAKMLNKFLFKLFKKKIPNERQNYLISYLISLILSNKEGYNTLVFLATEITLTINERYLNIINSNSSKDPISSSSTSSEKYVANVNTGIFHYLECSHVKKIKEKNKVYFNTSEAAKNARYKPCKRCNH